jgi:hypothetical protein
MALAEDILAYKKKHPRNYRDAATNWLLSSMAKPHKTVVRVNPDYLRIGSFYFMKYDVQRRNKTSRMEQFTPFLMVDYKPKIDSKVIYCLNFNFLTTQKKEAFFASFTEPYDAQMEKNAQGGDWLTEPPLTGVNYARMFGELLAYGFDYSIREYRVDLIHDIYGVSTAHLDKMVLLNTQKITGVDEAKLNDIWIAKLKKESYAQRVDELVRIKANYEKILLELQEKFKRLEGGL